MNTDQMYTSANARSQAARAGWQTRRQRQQQSAAAIMQTVQELADMLRETARGLRQWQSTAGCNKHGTCRLPEPCVHPMHAANRLEKWADRISSNKGGSK